MAMLDKDGLEYLWSKIKAAINNNGPVFGTTEAKIGTFDGKPLYRKVIKTTMTSWTTTSSFTAINVAHGISNLGVILNISAVVVRTDSTPRKYAIPYYDDSGALQTRIRFVDATNVNFHNKTAWGSSYTLYITIDYTKTTD